MNQNQFKILLKDLSTLYMAEMAKQLIDSDPLEKLFGPSDYNKFAGVVLQTLVAGEERDWSGKVRITKSGWLLVTPNGQKNPSRLAYCENGVVYIRDIPSDRSQQVTIANPFREGDNMSVYLSSMLWVGNNVRQELGIRFMKIKGRLTESSMAEARFVENLKGISGS